MVAREEAMTLWKIEVLIPGEGWTFVGRVYPEP